MIPVKITVKQDAKLPEYQSKGAAGADIHAFLENPTIIKPGETKLIPTGLSIELPSGYEAQIRPRSGLALKNGVTVLNTPGTIDADYRGDIGVIIYNATNEDVIIKHGDKIAQLVIEKHEFIDFKTVGQLPESVRGAGGFGSTDS